MLFVLVLLVMVKCCPQMSVDLLGISCDQCRSTVQ